MKKNKQRFLASGFVQTKEPEKDMHLVCGAGGIRAILGSMGAVFGLHAQGINRWKSIGGISGGSIIAALFAAGHHPRHLLRTAFKIDFDRLLVKKHGLLKVLRKYLRQKKHEVMPLTATLCSEPLGKLMDELVPVWPERLWIMAVANVEGKGRCQVLFTHQGTHLYTKEGKSEKISDTPPPVGLAIRASCAIPGALTHVSYLGMDLFDGVLSWDGRCPVGVARRHFLADYHNIVGCDVGDYDHPLGALHNRFMDHWVGEPADHRASLEHWERQGVKIVRATVNGFSSLHLKPSLKQRQVAIRSGYHAAHNTFKKKRTARGRRK